MTHFGVICPAATGHLNPMMSLSRELQNRGHSVTFFQLLDMEKTVRGGGFSFIPFAEKIYPLGSVPQLHRQLGELSGRQALEFTVDWIRNRTNASMNEVPSLARAQGVEAFLVDQVGMEGSTVAEELGVPFFTVSNALVLNQAPEIPPFFTTWTNDGGFLGELKNKIAYRAFNKLLRPSLVAINSRRKKLGLGNITGYGDAVSPLAHFSQQPDGFEFPRGDLPAQLKFVGPFQNKSVRAPVPFPYEKLNGKPIVYASMGTLQNRQGETFGCIAEACVDLPVQLIISLGGGSKPEEFTGFAGSPVVVEYAPQLELLERTALCVTHAGLNTVLECFANGVPMVAIPITNDQPGVAARLKWSGAGEFISIKDLSPRALREKIERVLKDPSYCAQANKMKQAIAQSNGVKTAADLIEEKLGKS